MRRWHDEFSGPRGMAKRHVVDDESLKKVRFLGEAARRAAVTATTSLILSHSLFALTNNDVGGIKFFYWTEILNPLIRIPRNKGEPKVGGTATDRRPQRKMWYRWSNAQKNAQRTENSVSFGALWLDPRICAWRYGWGLGIPFGEHAECNTARPWFGKSVLHCFFELEFNFSYPLKGFIKLCRIV